jgi:signal transduction histidine kinase
LDKLKAGTRIAQELHDTLLQGVISASMKLEVAMDALPDESSTRRALNGILNLMRRVIQEGRNTVRGLRLQQMEFDCLEQASHGIREQIAAPGDTEYRVIVEGRPRTLNPILRNEIYSIGREAVVNAFRHSGARRIEVEVAYAGELRLLVRDNGIGMDSAILRAGRDGHWGLQGKRERAEQIGARLTLWSRVSAGTEVALAVPGRLAYAPNNSDRKEIYHEPGQ